MLDGVGTFVCVIDAGSFSAAAERLGRSKSFVSKQVSELEDRLGARLLNRTTRSLSLTDVGRIYYERCQRIVSDADEAVREITESNARPRGLLRFSAPVSFGLGYLADVLPEFLERNPDLTLDIELNDSLVDIVAGHFDLALRIGRLSDSSLIARQIATAQGRTVAAPDYWDAHGRPEHPHQLRGHRCITYSHMRNPARWDYLGTDTKPISVNIDVAVQCNSGELETALAVKGLGVTRVPEFACARELAAGTLEPVLEEYGGALIGVYAVYPHRRHLSPKVRAFVDFLVEKFGGLEDW
ncbi:MAG: LysR family transcriptional regulator [Alphaproteobacteria bacterium]|nr:LysR family transcriptional regulator [Alphaproteobacteria bacterium]